ncbi:translation initiation factor IF-2-like [Myiozetetes cayanensis]|uniref:translation initiation factor IF-2-like n=1 Tax=Myiozetetes cayanensis TaxID=478635 RepID=UPI00215DF0F7|nr:translation initiation factor IF-2-like [Myiozetetes cayanensis]
MRVVSAGSGRSGGQPACRQRPQPAGARPRPHPQGTRSGRRPSPEAPGRARGAGGRRYGGGGGGSSGGTPLPGGRRPQGARGSERSGRAGTPRTGRAALPPLPAGRRRRPPALGWAGDAAGPAMVRGRPCCGRRPLRAALLPPPPGYAAPLALRRCPSGRRRRCARNHPGALLRGRDRGSGDAGLCRSEQEPCGSPRPVPAPLPATHTSLSPLLSPGVRRGPPRPGMRVRSPPSPSPSPWRAPLSAGERM